MAKSHFHPGQATQKQTPQQHVFYDINAPAGTVCRAYQTSPTSVALQQWDASTGHCTHDVRAMHGDWAENEVVTCMDAASMVIQPEDKPKAKKAKVSSMKQQVVAIGTSLGRVHLYLPEEGRVLGVLQGGVKASGKGHTDTPKKTTSTTAIQQIVLAAKSGLVFTMAQDKCLVVRTLDGAIVRSRKITGMTHVTAISLSLDESLIALASHKIHLIKVDSLKTIKTLTGHAESITSLAFSSDGRYCLSAATGDRYLYVWNGDETAEKEANSVPMTAIVSDDTIAGFAVHPITNHVMVTGGMGSMVRMYGSVTDAVAQGLATMTTPIATLTMTASVEQTIPIFRADFASVDETFEGPQRVLTVRGNAMSPVVETIPIMLSGSEETQHIVLTRDVVAGDAATEVKKTSRGRRQRINYLGPESAALPIMTTLAPTDDMETTEESLGDRLKELSVQQSSSDAPSKKGVKATKKANTGALQASSLEKTLSQALVTGDKQLLETCLGVRDLQIIQATLRRLENQHVLPLLDAIVQRFQASPNRAVILTRWLRTIMTTHMAYLLTLPNLATALQPLYNVVDSRLSIFDDLLQLSGRLDLIIAQMGMQSSASALEASVTNVPMASFQDYVDDDDEEESDQDEEDAIMEEAHAFSSSEEEESDLEHDDDDEEDEFDEEE